VEGAAQFVNRLDKHRHVRRIDVRRDAMPEIEHVTRGLSVGLEHRSHFRAHGRRRCRQYRGIEISLQGHAPAGLPPHRAQVHGPVQPDAIASRRGDLRGPVPSAAAEHDDRHRAAGVESRDDPLQILQGKFHIGAVGQHAAPAVEQHHYLRARRDLRVQVRRHGAREPIQECVQEFRCRVEHALGDLEITAGAALDHVGRERPRAAGEADQWHPAAELGTRQPDGVHDIAQFDLRVRTAQAVQVRTTADRAREPRSFVFDDAETEPHGVGNRENVGKENRGIQGESGQRLQRDLAGELRGLAQLEKAPGPLAGCPVLRQIASGLAHDPDGGGIDRLPEQRPQQAIILQWGIRHQRCYQNFEEVSGQSRNIPWIGALQ
jgi:hypothetical protein